MFGSLLRKTSSIECELLKVRNSREERETGQPLTWLVIQLTLFRLKISMHILHTVPNTLPKVLMRRICFIIQSFSS